MAPQQQQSYPAQDGKVTPRAAPSWLSSTFGHYGECVESSLESRYFRANVVYLMYVSVSPRERGDDRVHEQWR